MSKFQRDNLAKLATYLEGLPADYEDFDMAVFHEESEEPALQLCGSAACAVGHGLSAGIRAYPKDFSWQMYARRVFGTEGEIFSHGKLWDWCFTQEWQNYDNTPAGAALRIRAYLADKVPEWFEDEDQLECDPTVGPLYIAWKNQCATSA